MAIVIAQLFEMAMMVFLAITLWSSAWLLLAGCLQVLTMAIIVLSTLLVIIGLTILVRWLFSVLLSLQMSGLALFILVLVTYFLKEAERVDMISQIFKAR